MTNVQHTKYRRRLPQLGGGLFLSDGGLETTLVYHNGFDLPMFAAFTLIENSHGRAVLRAYYDRYVSMAARHGCGFILESPTWRANPDWGAKLGYDRDRLAAANRDCIAMLHDIRAAHATSKVPLVISGAIGPRGDGYDPGKLMRADDAQSYHAWQIGVLKEAGADLVSAFTLNNVSEAVGVVCAAKAEDMPCVISLTLETNGRLPTGEDLGTAIETVDHATGGAPAYYMINCAHPDHFSDALDADAAWMRRLRGIRANSSRKSHAELDNSTELDAGNPQELGEQYAALLRRFSWINVLGGCCGTDHRHVECISASCRGARNAEAA
ncbi:MAG TPA: homocysteine S-methyltransferase family protein [Methyloceanibacter sp.]|nr:homocysteine S-methyltransferase family protein [Methyloceanibacter sp.]